MEQDQIRKPTEKAAAKQLNDEELEQVNAGMKIMVTQRPKFFDVILRLLFKVKGKKD